MSDQGKFSCCFCHQPIDPENPDTLQRFFGFADLNADRIDLSEMQLMPEYLHGRCTRLLDQVKEPKSPLFGSN
jgi:hypothetical protein